MPRNCTDQISDNPRLRRLLTTSILTLANLFIAAQAFADATPTLNPAANREAIVEFGHARFTILTDRLIRAEWSATKDFEERASFFAVNRSFPKPAFTQTTNDKQLTIKTDHLTITYTEDGEAFRKDNFRIKATTSTGKAARFSPPFENLTNLGGTFRTLDGVSGATDLEPGIFCREGLSIIDDSHSLLFDDVSADLPWYAPRKDKNAIDWYILNHGVDYKGALKDFTRIGGPIPIPPRYAFGAWWSRYWAYSADELKTLVEEFRAADVPLDVLVVDMDWHLDGWTGYTWNPKYFPDPQGFLNWVHEQGLRTTLNLHPADGIGKHEAKFEEMAEALNIDPNSTDRIPFDCTNRNFVGAYFDVLHHPMEKAGIDFWWMDWQQGTKSAIEGIDPLFWLNHLHWHDMLRRADETNRRPLIFSRWGGLGNHRYQIGFSGDTFCNWPSLAFQPFFTSTASNVGFGYWSHDIGGHQPGPVDPEMYTRWIQFGALSPILRTHTTKNPDAERRLWKFPTEFFSASRDAFNLRYALAPYIYTAAHEAYETGVSICRPLYYNWPDIDEAYENTNEYMFGNDLLVAPVVAPADEKTGLAMTTVWLPPGSWTHWYSGRVYQGPADIKLVVPINEIPLFARDGAVIPMVSPGSRMGVDPYQRLTIKVFPGNAGSAIQYDDDGISNQYTQGKFATTEITATRSDDTTIVNISPASGGFDNFPKMRRYDVHIRNATPAAIATINGESASRDFKDGSGFRYDTEELAVVVSTKMMPTNEPIEIVIEHIIEPELTSAIKDGLCGRLQLAEEINYTLGTSAPAVWHQTLSLRSSLMQGNVGPASMFGKSQLAAARLTPLLFSELVDGVKDHPQFFNWTSRLLGLYRELDLSPDENAEQGVVLSAEIAVTDGMTNDAETSILVVPPPGWTIPESAGGIKPVTGGMNASVSMPIKAMGSLGEQSAILTSTASVSVGDRTLDFAMQRTLLPSINAWQIVGPFHGEFDKALATVYPPEEETEEIDLTATYKGKDDKSIGWKVVKRTVKPGDDLSSEFFVDFDDVFGGRVYNGVAYAFTYLDADRPMDVTLALGSDDGIAVWLNGEEVHRNKMGRAYTSKQDRIPVKLKQGENTLMLKINQGGGDWGFCVHIEGRNGGPISNVRSRHEPKK